MIHRRHFFFQDSKLNVTLGNSRYLRNAQACFVIAAALILGCNSSSPTDRPDSLNNTADGSRAVLTRDVQYVEDSQCAQCHQEIYDSYQDVAMAKSFYNFDSEPAIESFADNKFFHAASGNHYEMNVVDNQISMTRFRQRADGTRYAEHEQSAQFVVGSGNHVKTYVYRNEIGEMYQLPVVWYSQDSKWGMAPGYDRSDHPDFGRKITRQCMFCHNAYPDIEPSADQFGKPHRFPKTLPQGIGCQRCHGPGSEHIRISNEEDEESAKGLKMIRNSIVNSARLDSQLQDDVCNQCHFQPMSQRTSFIRKSENEESGDYGFRPGNRLAEFMLHFEPDRDNDLANHFEINHHPYRLNQSRCYIETPGGIRCTDCHDPHVKVKKPQATKYYRDKCFTCHEQNDCLDLEQGRADDADCISCHMRARRTTDVVNVTMTDHKISRRPRLKNPTAPLSEIDVPIQMPIREYDFPGANKDGPALNENELRIYKLLARAVDDDESAIEPLAELSRQQEPFKEAGFQLAQMQLQSRQYESAIKTLRRMGDSLDGLSAYHVNLGVGLIGNGQLEIAIESLKTAIKVDPNDASAWYNLATAQERSGDLDKAIESLNRATSLRPNYAKAFTKLGTLLALSGEQDQSIQQLNRAIAIDPNNLSAFNRLATVHRAREDFGSAISVLKNATANNPDDRQINLEMIWTLLAPGNVNHRDSEQCNQLADKLYQIKSDSDSILTRVLAMIESGKHQPALDFLGQNLRLLDQAKRKPESGLLLAVCQHKLGSQESALQNYKAASQAIQSQSQDRLARLITGIAEQTFSKQR